MERGGSPSEETPTTNNQQQLTNKYEGNKLIPVQIPY